MSDLNPAKVISVIKSCLAIAKYSLSLEQLENDYTDLVGSGIPYQDYGHTNLYSFLHSSNEFRFSSGRSGALLVNTIGSKDTEHIEQFIQGQKNSKKRTKPKILRNPRRVFRPSNWNLHPQNQRYYGHPMPRASHYIQSPVFPAPHSGPRISRPTITTNNSWRPHQVRPRGFASSNSFIPREQQQSQFTKVKTPQSTEVIPSFSASTKISVKPLLSKELVLSPSILESKPVIQSQSKSSSIEKVNIPPLMSPNQPPRSSLQQSKSSELNTVTSLTSSKEKLLQITALHGLKAEFSITQGGGGKKPIYFLSVIKVGNSTFHSYPRQERTKAEAEELASQNALQGLKLQLSQVKTFTKDNFLAAERIKNILCEKNKGTWWWKYLQEEYTKQYQELLPPDWITKAIRDASLCSGIFFQENTDDWLVSLASPNSIDEINDSPVEIDRKSQISEQNILIEEDCNLEKMFTANPLLFPSDKMWEIFVTHIENCNEIWFRLIQDDYNDKFEDLTTEMELYYMEAVNQTKVNKFMQQNYYACNHEESWFRVQLVSMNEFEATVMFVDHGDYETVPLDSLYNLTDDFMKLPLQSIRASLVGLEEIGSNKDIYTDLHNLALGRTLVAEVISCSQDSTSVVLFDTSTDQDVNINEKLFKLIPQTLEQPSLPPVGGICEVYVCHVSIDGEINVRLEPASYDSLQELLLTARRRTAEMLGGDPIHIDLTKLYLAKFNSDGEWHRASPKAISNNQEAISVRLHQVPSSPGSQWTERVSNKMMELLPSDKQPILLEVMEPMTSDQSATVQLFTRMQPQNLVSINKILNNDESLFLNEDRNNNIEAEATNGDTSTDLDTLLAAPFFCPLQHTTLPLINTDFDIYVTFAAGPFNFSVQPWKNIHLLQDLMKELNLFYSNKENLSSCIKVEQNMFYAVLHSDGTWYRSEVQNVDGNCVMGRFVDYGDCFSTTLECVQPLSLRFKQLPSQSIKAKLYGIEPLHFDWTPEACIHFSRMVQDKELVSFVTGIDQQGLDTDPVLVLRLIDTRDPHVDVDVATELVKRKFAKIKNSKST